MRYICKIDVVDTFSHNKFIMLALDSCCCCCFFLSLIFVVGFIMQRSFNWVRIFFLSIAVSPIVCDTITITTFFLHRMCAFESAHARTSLLMRLSFTRISYFETHTRARTAAHTHDTNKFIYISSIALNYKCINLWRLLVYLCMLPDWFYPLSPSFPFVRFFLSFFKWLIFLSSFDCFHLIFQSLEYICAVKQNVN